MANIADLFGRLLLDDNGFEAAVLKSAQSAGDKAGSTMGATLSKSFRAVGFSALSLAFADAAKGAGQLDVAVKQYAADVGASAEESDKAKAAAIDLFKTNRQGYDEILQTLAKLRTDQGLTVDQADELAASYLRFAKVAGGTAPEAVKAFDDVQDAWNLTAEQGVKLMDQLFASTQKYGGSVQQRVADLKTLAPALRGLGLTIDQAIGLENAFANAGLDGSQALRALNSAIANLKPGQTLDDLIHQVSSIEDPTLRAQKAIEIFGGQGSKLANVFRPGIKSLDDLTISATAAGPAIKTASDTIDSSIPAQFQLALKGIQGTLQELVGPAGPVLLAISSLAQLALAFDALKVSAIAGWLATLGPVALVAGAGVAFIALVNATDATNQAQLAAAQSAGLLTGAQAKLKAEADAGTISWDEYDSKLDAIQSKQQLQARSAALAAGATNAEADAAGAAAVANDTGATAAQVAATANANLAAATAAGTVVIKASVGPLATAQDRLLLFAGAYDIVTQATRDATDAEILHQAAINQPKPTREKLVGDVIAPMSDTDLLKWLDDLRAEEKRLRLQAEADAKAARAKALADAKAAAADYARTVEGGLKDAFRASKAAADDFFDALHKRRLADIEDARKTADAELEAQKKGLFAEVDAEQAALDARHKAEQRQGLVAGVQQAALGVGEAQAGGDPKAVLAAVQQLRAAQAALRDFDEQARIDAERVTAQAASDAIDAQITANDAKAALAVDGENKTAAARKKAFDDGLAKLENDLLTEKGSHAKTLKAIADLYTAAGIDTKSQGAQIALGLAAGLLSEIKAVESAAETLAKAVAKYIKIGSPAKAGPFHDDPPESMGRALTAEWWKGIVGGLADLDLSSAMGDLAGGLSLPSMAMAGVAGGPIAPGAARAVVPNLAGSGPAHFTVDLGETFSRLFGTNRFVDVVSRELAYRRRS